jgi:hypothetical protein
MNGGQIADNFVIGTDGDPSGGGVFVIGEEAIFILAGGQISGNKVDRQSKEYVDNGGNGGGVCVSEGATFIMQGGAISNNDASSHKKYGGGGGVFVFRAKSFIMEGGTISGNFAPYNGGVGIQFTTFTMKGGRIQGSKDSDGFTKNSGPDAALFVHDSTAKWGMGGTYTKDGVPQTDGSVIVAPIDANNGRGTDDTLIATPAR